MMTRRKLVRDALVTMTGGFVTASTARLSGKFSCYDETAPSPIWVWWCGFRHHVLGGPLYVWHLGPIDANPRSKPAFITEAEAERRTKANARRRGVPYVTCTDGGTVQIMPDGAENRFAPDGKFLGHYPAKGSNP